MKEKYTDFTFHTKSTLSNSRWFNKRLSAKKMNRNEHALFGKTQWTYARFLGQTTSYPFIKISGRVDGSIICIGNKRLRDNINRELFRRSNIFACVLLFMIRVNKGNTDQRWIVRNLKLKMY